jgi:hypothetical protein
MRPNGSAARGVLSGAIAGAGACAAHVASGGDVTAVAGVLAFLLSIVLGHLLARDGDTLRIAALALGAQSVWHLVFVVTAPVSPAVSGDPTGHGAPGAHAADEVSVLTMLGAHLLMAALSAGVAIGLDRTLVGAALRVASALVPRPIIRSWQPVTPWTPAPVATEPCGLGDTATFLVVRVLRGPPPRTASAPCG